MKKRIKNRPKFRWNPLGLRPVSDKKEKKETILMKVAMKVKHRFCPLCRQWYPWGYGFVRHECCKKYHALKMESGWELVKQLKDDEFVEESRRIMLATQEKNSFKEITR